MSYLPWLRGNAAPGWAPFAWVRSRCHSALDCTPFRHGHDGPGSWLTDLPVLLRTRIKRCLDSLDRIAQGIGGGHVGLRQGAAVEQRQETIPAKESRGHAFFILHVVGQASQAAPGGGYILSSSNSWYTDVKLENCLAMVETGRKYGVYPTC